MQVGNNGYVYSTQALGKAQRSQKSCPGCAAARMSGSHIFYLVFIPCKFFFLAHFCLPPFLLSILGIELPALQFAALSPSSIAAPPRRLSFYFETGSQ